MDDVTRLARMAHLRSFPAGTLLLRQTEQPMYLYVLMKGACKVGEEDLARPSAHLWP
jgi:CRP-like cAMP-binding protein